MDDDLTASHWDDVLPSSTANVGISNIGSIFDSLDLDDPHRDQHHAEDAERASGDDNAHNNDEEDEGDSPAETVKHESFNTSSYNAHAHTFGGAYDTQPSPFQASTHLNQSEMDELTAIKKQERDSHKSTLLMELTSSADDAEVEHKPAGVAPAKVSVAESLFEDKGSPIKINHAVSEPLGKYAMANSITSPTRASQLKGGKFKAPRGRKIPAKTVVKHLDDGHSADLDPLSSSTAPLQPSAQDSSTADKAKSLFQEANSPLYDLPKPNNDGADVNPVETTSTSQVPPSDPKTPENTHDTNTIPNGNDLVISLGDPVKVGDITTAHIVYGIKTLNNNSQSAYFPETSDPIFVSRRYKDFRWIYHQLQNNHPGKIIPPPPSKQTYIGRFNENFIENRRLLLEKMLNKISKIPVLANDGDFILFLTSQNFANDSKEREQASGSGASIQASNGDDEGEKSSSSIVSGTGAGGFMSSLFSMTVKYPEPDDFFSKKKGYIEDLEHNLKTFYKSLELIASQRIEIASVIAEIAAVVEELADLEISKTTTNLLSAFAEVHSKLKENLDRVNLQDQLTLGFTIEEYLRIIGSVKSTFETRSKIYQLYQSFKQDLMKKEESLARLNSRYKTSVDKINQVAFEVDKLKQKTAYYENSFKTISDTIKTELDNFEMEKIKDFRNSVEIFIESSIESQKEAIELWETFYERQNLTSV